MTTRARVPTLLALLVALAVGGCGSEQKGQTSRNITITTREDIFSNYVTGATYYLDADQGSDEAGDGSSDHPWKTLAKSQAAAPAGSAVILRNGNYGTFNDDTYPSSRSAWTVYINDEGATPVLNNVNFGHSNGPNLSLKLIFYGIKIAPAWVDPGPTDPMDPNSDLSTYAKSASPVGIGYRDDVRFYNCELVGTNKYLTAEAAYLSYANSIVFERCHIHKVSEGIVYVHSTNLTMDYNYIHEVTACFFKDGTSGSSGITIEGNHAHDANWSLNDPYCPKAPGKNYHGSMIAVNSSDTTIRNNILHDGGGTNGICFYTDGNPVYFNVLIENNLVYNPHNSTCVLLDQIADNIVVRNNTFVGLKRGEGEQGEYRYNNALTVFAYASGYNGSGLHIYNNVFVGRAGFGAGGSNVNKDYNIVYFGDEFATAYSVVAFPDWDYFESGFFGGALNLEYGSVADQVLDLTLTAGSEAINFGDPSRQPSDSLGSLDSSGYIVPDGAARDGTHHSVGCYEKR